jgi:hypothetical protein
MRVKGIECATFDAYQILIRVLGFLRFPSPYKYAS